MQKCVFHSYGRRRGEGAPDYHRNTKTSTCQILFHLQKSVSHLYESPPFQRLEGFQTIIRTLPVPKNSYLQIFRPIGSVIFEFKRNRQTNTNPFFYIDGLHCVDPFPPRGRSGQTIIETFLVVKNFHMQNLVTFAWLIIYLWGKFVFYLYGNPPLNWGGASVISP